MTRLVNHRISRALRYLQNPNSHFRENGARFYYYLGDHCGRFKRRYQTTHYRFNIRNDSDKFAYSQGLSVAELKADPFWWTLGLEPIRLFKATAGPIKKLPA